MLEGLFYVLTGVGGLSGVASIVICWLVYRQLQRDAEERRSDLSDRKDLRRKVETFETDRFARLEKTVDEHLRNDNPAKQDGDIGKITGELTRLTNELAAYRRESQTEFRTIASKLGLIEGRMVGIDKWMDNINVDFQKHNNDRNLHHGN